MAMRLRQSRMTPCGLPGKLTSLRALTSTFLLRLSYFGFSGNSDKVESLPTRTNDCKPLRMRSSINFKSALTLNLDLGLRRQDHPRILREQPVSRELADCARSLLCTRPD
jgi:hypothetical protein